MHLNNTQRIKIPIRNIILAIPIIVFSDHIAARGNPEYKLGGDFSYAYSTNQYDKNDYLSQRQANWSGTLSLNLSERYSTYLTSGGYRTYENETGDFLTDTVIGFADNQLADINQTGLIKYNVQLSIPTSEQSKKDELNSAIRLALTYVDKFNEFNYYLSPRVRKNLHKYKTAGEKSLEEWILSLNAGIGYRWNSLSVNASLLGGTSWSYQHTRRDWKYSGSISGTWSITENLYTTLSASNSGVYFDAEKGTIGDIDLFNERTATYSLSVGYRF